LHRRQKLSTLHLSILGLLLLQISAGTASSTTVDFEGLKDADVLTTQIPGLNFSDAIVSTAGVSLNEFEFPPHSGSNVISDYQGPISIDFAKSVTSVGGYYTYAEALTVTAFDSAGMELNSTASPYFNNEALSGEVSSRPNEYLSISSSAGIAHIVVAGDPDGSSFALDDLTYVSTPIAVPEPALVSLLMTGALSLARVVRLFSLDNNKK
jgi:hypothetical protein